MKWVLAHNQTTIDKLSKDPRFAQNQAEALAILQATDRIAYPTFAHKGLVQNFWQDSEHTHGLWRQTTWDSYKTATPQWDTILDIDALSKAEGKNWVWEGANCLAPDYTRCLIELSDGGKDATIVREFDITTKSFITGGFELPEGKQSVTWRDADTVYVTREWTPGDVTESSYAYITKVLKRGQTLDQAVEIYRGTKSDVSAGRTVLRDVDGRYVMDYAYRGLDFFHTPAAVLCRRQGGRAAPAAVIELQRLYEGSGDLQPEGGLDLGQGHGFQDRRRAGVRSGQGAGRSGKAGAHPALPAGRPSIGRGHQPDEEPPDPVAAVQRHRRGLEL